MYSQISFSNLFSDQICIKDLWNLCKMQRKDVWLIPFCVYFVMNLSSTTCVGVNSSPSDRAAGSFRPLWSYYNVQPDQKILDILKSYDGIINPIRISKKPFFTQPITYPKYSYSTPLKRMKARKRIVCNKGSDSNCKYLFTFLNRS